MGEEGFYPPYSLAILHERLKEGLEPSPEERAALHLPYPQVPDLIKDYQTRRPTEFKEKFIAPFELKKILNYREFYSYFKLLSQGVAKNTLSGFGHTAEERSFASSRTGYRVSKWGYYGTIAGSVVGFNLVYTLPLWFRSFGLFWVIVGNTAMVFGSRALWYPVLTHYHQSMLSSASQCIASRKEELDKLVKAGVLQTEDCSHLAEFPPNPFNMQVNIEKKKIAVWSYFNRKKE